MLMLTNGRVKLQIFKGKPELFCLGELTKPTLKKWHLRYEITRWWNSSWAISNPKRWCCSSLNISTNLKNATVTSGLEKGSFHSNPKEGQCQRMFYHTIALISHASKVMFKILLAWLQQHVNWELPDIQAGFWTGRRIRDQIAIICWIMEKARKF